MSGIEVEIEGSAGSFAVSAAFRSDAAVTGIAGPSGAGKTTLLRMIAGLLTPRSGRIQIGDALFFDAGRGVNLRPEERRTGMVFQDARLFAHMRVGGNLAYGAHARGIAMPEGELLRVAGLLGITSVLRRFPSKLSGGERQRVAIGRALLSGPRLLILDEPLTSVDRERRDMILPFLLDDCKAKQIPVLLVSHDETDIARYCQEAVRVDSGKAVLVR